MMAKTNAKFRQLLLISSLAGAQGCTAEGDSTPNDRQGSGVKAENSPSAQGQGDAGAEDVDSDAAPAQGACSPLLQRDSQGQEVDVGPSSGVLECESGAYLVQALPESCARVGEDWTQWDGGWPVACPAFLECLSGLCDPDGDCVGLSECVDDGDCQVGEGCVCSGWMTTNRCLPVMCSSAGDCGEFACAVSRDKCGDFEGVYCHTAADECTTDSDCGDSRECAYAETEQRWRCVNDVICE